MRAKIDLDLNDVALLVRVVQRRSFSAAARERGVPVSTVSRRIARLESALGLRLLERTTRTLRLTDAGRKYFDHAERAMDDLAQGTGRVRELQDEPRGRVRIAAPTAFGAAVANVVYLYLAKHPGVSIDLEIDGRRPDPDSGFDIAIMTEKLNDTDDFVAREVRPMTRKLLFASPHYLKEHGTPRGVEELAVHDCIATRATDGHATWTLAQGRTKRRFTFAPRLYVSEFSAAYRAVLAGVGIAMLPESLCAQDVNKRHMARVLEGWEGEAAGVYLLYRAHRSLTAAVRTCIDHLLAELPATQLVRSARET
ncbi:MULTISPECIES: LysR family transcriptional regulator [Corallococcus]|uniref:LysR family transcriptional regulator n=1 Tax=Corallococcus TaxID=83461 RepID=UPI000EBB3B9A|nr:MULTISPECIES: LysR family transcriptional regulator [Corallococcus]NPD23465.1 LysR family transcriptional regulator [Corallococcus exiguus]NRD47084.1 LysR family transcriptional regulator [Corallococcus exiguus]RKI05047.1 LysR family transcriptional regulator [Corallococcus sp. AB038B]